MRKGEASSKMYRLKSVENKEKIENVLHSLEQLNSEYTKMLNSKEVVNSIKWNHFFKYFNKLDFQGLFQRYKIRKNMECLPVDITDRREEITVNDYFLDEKIAVYTVMFGEYDSIREPVYIPDNCDFYVITDQDIDKTSAWKRISIEEFSIKDFSNAEKNRYFKMHPEKIFPNYKYSIYLDSNIVPVSDLTAMVNRMGKYPIAYHGHRDRDCVYSEAVAALKLGKMSKEGYSSYMQYLSNCNFPKHIGLAECNVIVRKHNEELCIKLMEQWWKLFSNGQIKRDQLLLPLVLFEYSIPVNDICTLGNNVYTNRLVRVEYHN